MQYVLGRVEPSFEVVLNSGQVIEHAGQGTQVHGDLSVVDVPAGNCSNVHYSFTVSTPASEAGEPGHRVLQGASVREAAPAAGQRHGEGWRSG